MADESPVIDETPEIEPTEAETEAPVDVDALLGQLEKFNVTDARKLEGKLRNANDYAKIQSERDRLANEIASIKGEMANMRQEWSKPKPESYDEYESGKPVDIESLVEKGVERVLKRNQEAQMKQQQWMAQTWNKISGHPKYHLVKEDFEEALRDPAMVMEITSGRRDPVEMFHDMLLDKYENVTKQTVAAFKQLRGTGTVNAPHVETSARVPNQPKTELTDKDKKINELRQKAKKPGGLHDDEEDFMIEATLGDLLK